MAEFTHGVCGEEALYMPELEPCNECDAFEERLSDVEYKADLLKQITDALSEALGDKQDLLTPGQYIDITDNVISAMLGDFYTAEEVDALIQQMDRSEFQVVAVLPATGASNIIYLLDNGDGYDQYIYTNGSWVKIGTTTVTISESAILQALGATVRADISYPVGSYYATSDASFNPNTAWGGTWVLLEEGRALISAGENYTAGDQYGENEHTLTEDEMPSHTHVQNAHIHGSPWGAYLTSNGDIAVNGTSRNFPSTGGGKHIVYSDSAISIQEYTTTAPATASNKNTGGSQPHNNMQLSTAAYIWHRTA